MASAADKEIAQLEKQLEDARKRQREEQDVTEADMTSMMKRHKENNVVDADVDQVKKVMVARHVAQEAELKPLVGFDANSKLGEFFGITRVMTWEEKLARIDALEAQNKITVRGQQKIKEVMDIKTLALPVSNPLLAVAKSLQGQPCAALLTSFVEGCVVRVVSSKGEDLDDSYQLSFLVDSGALIWWYMINFHIAKGVAAKRMFGWLSGKEEYAVELTHVYGVINVKVV